MRPNYWGEFCWFHGVVENRNDPLKLGRVQCRIVGYHTDDKVLIPTADLPWAVPMQPITSAAMNGIGESPLGLVEGTHVVGFFRDGISAQDPIIMGSIGGIPQSVADITKGFNDPSGSYPLNTRLSEPDTNRLCRTDIEHPVVQAKKDAVDTNVPLALTGTWSEPETEFAPEYPFNHVEESESGHIREVDDTEGKERLHTYHKAGTFEEIHPNGKKVTKIVADNYKIVYGSDYAHVIGNCNVTVNEDINIRSSNGNTTIEVANGNCVLNVNGNLDADISGNLTADITGTTDINGIAPISITGGSIITIEALGLLQLKGSPIKLN